MLVHNPTSRAAVLRPSTCLARVVVTSSAMVATAAADGPAGSSGPAGPAGLPQPLLDLVARCGADLTPDQRRALLDVVTDYKDIFSCQGEIGHCELVEHTVDTGETPPIKQAPRRLDFHKQTTADKCIDEMLQQGVIQPSTSPWASPVVLLKKKDGSTRFAIDYRALNTVTRKDAYPLPRIDTILDSLHGASWFSSLDLRSGYWNIPLAEPARAKTAFTVPGHGLYEFLRMPFGLANAPATFQRLMDRIVPRDIARVYLDDIVVPGASFDQALANLRRVFDRIRAANFLLAPKKCTLFAQRLEYLGHVISSEGVATNPQKTAKVRDWPVPKDKAQLNSFLRLAQYYSQFVKDFATIAAPLNALMQKAREFTWSPEAQHAFDALRTALCSTPVLSYPDPQGGPFVLDCDASNFAVGCCLSQVQNGEERLIAYHSETFNKAGRNYCITRKELYALVSGLRHFHPYLAGAPFIVRTDHAALKWLRTMKDTVEGQLARWLERLEAYQFEIVHRAGALHGNADALSRRPCEEGCRHCARHEVAVNSTAIADVDLPTRAELRAAQSTDLDTMPILLAKQRDERPPASAMSDASVRTKALWLQWHSLDIHDGLLSRRFESTRLPHDVTWQAILPRALVPRIMRHFHDRPGVGGHLGGNKTADKIRTLYYWPGLCADVKLWVASCPACRQRKGPGERPRAPLKPYNVGAPWERVAVDIVSGLPRTARGNRYILVVLDYYTRWPEAFPIADTTADTVARVLVTNVFSRYGAPVELHSDQGSQFESLLFKTVLEQMGTRKTRTTPGRPQSDGAVERLIRTLVQQLAIVSRESKKDWDLQVPLVLLSLRAAPHSTTGLSPAMMMYGRDINLPPVMARGPVPDQRAPRLPKSDYPAWLHNRLRDLHHSVRERADTLSWRMKQRYDIRAKRPRITAGSSVWLFDPRRRVGKPPKLESWWAGPYAVEAMLNDVVAKIRLPGSRKRPRIVHTDRLATVVHRGGRK